MRSLGPADIKDGVVLRVTRAGIRLPKGRGIGRLMGRYHWAFRGVGFTLRRGEAIGVLGRNGSGKTTLLRALAGILEIDEGEILSAPDASSVILAPGVGFEDQLTGRENIYNSALYNGYLPSAITPKIQQIIDFSEIGNWIDQPTAIYSGGMRARLGFSLSLYLPAEILMIDETLSAGDAGFREKAKFALQELMSSDRTVILVSHDFQTLRNMCSRGILLDMGQQVADGPIDEIIDRYERIISDLQKDSGSHSDAPR